MISYAVGRYRIAMGVVTYFIGSNPPIYFYIPLALYVLYNIWNKNRPLRKVTDLTEYDYDFDKESLIGIDAMFIRPFSRSGVKLYLKSGRIEKFIIKENIIYIQEFKKVMAISVIMNCF